jgi:hypothetical protein
LNEGTLHVHFDLIDLRLFLYVVEAGSITAGAARAALGHSVPSASHPSLPFPVFGTACETGRLLRT